MKIGILLIKLPKIELSQVTIMNTIKASQISGIGELERERLSSLLRDTRATISVAEAAVILNLSPMHAAKILASYAKKGWLKRIYRGLYLSVPLESGTSDIVAEEPFIIAQKLFSPCYVAGMNAANYWGLTEQIFLTITVMTQNKVINTKTKILDTEYIIHSIKPLYFFGLKSIWISNVKVQISDPTRTIIDMAIFPQFCGGLGFFEEVLKNYYSSKYKDVNLLMKYLDMAKNGAAIKRLGYLFERYFPDEGKFIDYCLENLTKGYIKLASTSDCSKIIKRWRLWMPESYKEIR
jgi:predicted transcriptional regulator of viral defense system